MKHYRVYIKNNSASRLIFQCAPETGLTFGMIVMRETGHATVLTRTGKHASRRVADNHFTELRAAVTRYIQTNGLDCQLPVKP